ncbi:hypothetical protein NDU88_004752 [Pleurodeles waltl]|uniref:Uncharacterized protein n=1 Tax=Pleurodeles waltl TaxID=8319 RepID=A0AAV7VJ42_PLEWA|nr:hypothetical protein NDU88_004752 [Pleurodeles waltl]
MFLFAIRSLGLEKRPVASLREAWRLSSLCAAPPGCSGRSGASRSRVALRQREERGLARQSGFWPAVLRVGERSRPWYLVTAGSCALAWFRRERYTPTGFGKVILVDLRS